MKHPNQYLLAGVALMALTCSSCNRNMFDQGDYERIVEIESPVDSVDLNHTWDLASARSITFLANAGGSPQKLQVLTENPCESDKAELITQCDISNGQEITLALSFPTYRTTLYAALVDEDGNYTVKPFDAQTTSYMDFSNATYLNTPVSYTPKPQTYVYLYEQEIPEPGDYDFNDCVLAISQERTGESQISIHVTLRAVGSNMQLACALRLVDYLSTDIEQVTTVGDESFNKRIPGDLCYLIGNTNTLLRGRKKEAVINVFEDAHWATGDRLSVDYGILQNRFKYNVSKRTGNDTQLFIPRTVTYVVDFKDGSRLNEFSMDSIDPFIVKDYMGSIWEIHQFPHRYAQTMKEYSLADPKNLPWALRIPYGDFRHALEGVNIGFIQRGRLFGAYGTRGHGFGEWAEYAEQSTDWFFFPTENNVF